MMRLKTQDGRILELSREYKLFISGKLKGNGHKAQLAVTTMTKSRWDDIPFSERHKYPDYEVFPDHEVVNRYGIIGEYATDTGYLLARGALQKAWNDEAAEFTVPQDTFKASADEEFRDFVDAHNLICVSANELGYSNCDTARNLHIWRTTDEFERRNILVCDPETYTYEKSFAKWKALQSKKVVDIKGDHKNGKVMRMVRRTNTNRLALGQAV